MKKQILSILLVCLMVLGCASMVSATEVEETTEAAETTETTETTESTAPVRGEFACGDDLVWSYEDGVLTITGSGAMDDYGEGAPWIIYRSAIEKVVLEGVTYIGSHAFYNYDKLETVEFGNALREIGPEAFRSCEKLEKIELPSTFKIFGEACFRECSALKEIHCSGNFPSFRLNSMWQCYLTIYYPAERPWSVDLIEQLENAFHNRIEFIASDGTDHYPPTEATTAPPETEVPTEPPTEAPTETTEAPTEPSEETTVPGTEATTVPAESETTAATEPVVEDTVPAPSEEITPEDRETSNQVVLLGMGIALGLTIIAALLLVIRNATKKGKYTR